MQLLTVLFPPPEIDVQLVGLVKMLIDSENIMAEAGAVSHMIGVQKSHDGQYNWLKGVMLKVT